MKNLIESGKLVKVVALGCGSKIPQILMGEGSSKWLHSIDLNYSYESIAYSLGMTVEELEKYFEENSVKAVSKEFVDKIYENDPTSENPDVITVVMSASLGYRGQREGRVNHFYVKFGGEETIHIEMDSKLSREQQEDLVAETFLSYFLRNQTVVVFSGSFNPWHDGHQNILNCISGDYKISNYPIIVDMSSKHPEKGEIDMDELKSRGESITGKGNVEVVISNAPKYIDKYIYYNKLFSGQNNIVFLVGYDIWETYQESFHKEFRKIDNVYFLVFHRYSNEKSVNPSSIVHPYSFCKKTPEPLLSISSTQIRNEKSEN